MDNIINFNAIKEARKEQLTPEDLEPTANKLKCGVLIGIDSDTEGLYIGSTLNGDTAKMIYLIELAKFILVSEQL